MNITKKQWTTIIVAVLGVTSMILGLCGAFDSEEANKGAIQTGASITTQAAISEYPDSKVHIEKVVSILDAAIEARTGDAEAIVNTIAEALDTAVANPAIKSIITLINDAKEMSETEEEFLEKLQLIVNGIKASL